MNTKNKYKLSQYAISFISVSIAALIGFSIVDLVGYKVVAFLLLVTVSILAMIFDILPVLFAAILSALIWDFFFIPPKFTFSVGTAEDRILLLMYFIIASVNAALTYKIRQIEKEDRKKEEKENAIKLYNTLFNSLSHELQTPITTIIGASDTLNDGSIKLSDKNKSDLVNEISIAALRLNEQVQNLMNMSRLESGYLKLKQDWCDINELIYSVVNKLQNKSNKHKIEIIVPENFPLFKLDYGIMEQVIYNLLNNAIHYTPDNSTITITTKQIHLVTGHFDKSDKISDVHRDSISNKLIIIVSDNGTGFPQDEIKKVFDKFYRLSNTKAGGTGLGLSIVKGFVEAHKGTIELKNNSGGGAEFTISIPTQASYLNSLKHE